MTTHLDQAYRQIVTPEAMDAFNQAIQGLIQKAESETRHDLALAFGQIKYDVNHSHPGPVRDES